MASITILTKCRLLPEIRKYDRAFLIRVRTRETETLRSSKEGQRPYMLFARFFFYTEDKRYTETISMYNRIANSRNHTRITKELQLLH